MGRHPRLPRPRGPPACFVSLKNPPSTFRSPGPAGAGPRDRLPPRGATRSGLLRVAAAWVGPSALGRVCCALLACRWTCGRCGQCRREHPWTRFCANTRFQSCRWRAQAWRCSFTWRLRAERAEELPVLPAPRSSPAARLVCSS